ncbi:uncharacterized protein IL334_005165 [Kwoniella shivajii]|uniref:Alpha/beta hydrolase fold-3 domain-containing protein n=1 Tax=Kwoniella shivajii TaxID=564305 RepID=A0ABZ1D2R6_9TREE|nr:hypothetical protein IL334_005165 [Kwoniella shivajii]
MNVETQPLSERSWFMHLLETLIRPFRPRLVAPPSNLESKLEWSKTGSPRLSVSSSLKTNCVVTERCIHYIWCYNIDIKQNHRQDGEVERKKGRVLYFAGGGFHAPPSSQHWSLILEFARRLPQFHLTLVSYPLSMKSTASAAIPALSHMYHELASESKRNGQELILAGDSSGGNVALSLALHVLSSSFPSKDAIAPRSIMLISPVVDCSNSNPEMTKVSKVDPVLTTQYTGYVARKWRGDLAPSDPLVSPVHADLAILKQNGVQVNGIVGTWDVLAPDTLEFIDRCKAVKVDGSWCIAEGQMHCFPLTWKYRLTDGIKGKEWIINTMIKSI